MAEKERTGSLRALLRIPGRSRVNREFSGTFYTIFDDFATRHIRSDSVCHRGGHTYDTLGTVMFRLRIRQLRQNEFFREHVGTSSLIRAEKPRKGLSLVLGDQKDKLWISQQELRLDLNR